MKLLTAIFSISFLLFAGCTQADHQKKELLNKINRLRGNDPGREIVVSLEDFFNGNNDLSSIGANLADEQPSIEKFYSHLKDIRSRTDVQDVLVRIYDAPDENNEWASTDTVYLLTSLSKDEAARLFSPLKPTEIHEGWMYGHPKGSPALKNGIKPFSIWWD